MKKNFNFMMAALVAAASMSLSSCSDSDDNSDSSANLSDGVRVSSTISQKTSWTTSDYSNKSYGQAAVDYCATLADELVSASNMIVKNSSKFSDSQEEELKNVIEGVVDNVIIPTYTQLADATEDLNASLKGLSTSSLTQTAIDNACASFKEARLLWERSEAFLGGAASDFDVDPTIDSWPLDRNLLLTYFKDGEFTDEAMEDASILGFHALEFILFRDGENRKVADFKANDTYKNFESVPGSAELAYAQAVCELLYQRCCQLQVAWEGTSNSTRTAVVKAAGLDYVTSRGLSYGENMKNFGSSKSTFSDAYDVVQQLLSMDEGSAYGICNEVGTAKIANPFSHGDVSYVESPYSYNSITDFQNNIRSIQNVWFGGTNGANSSASHSFHKFFANNGGSSVNTNVENSIVNAINSIGSMPYPFVKYVSTIWNVNFEDVDVSGE